MSDRGFFEGLGIILLYGAAGIAIVLLTDDQTLGGFILGFGTAKAWSPKCTGASNDQH